MTHRPVSGSGEPVGSVPRRRVLQGLAGVGVTAAAALLLSSPAHAAPAAPARLDWDQFDRAIRDGFDRIHITAAAVAVVSADQVLQRPRWALGPSAHGARSPR